MKQPNKMSEKQQEWLVSASRVLSAISGLFAPIILIISVGVFNKLDTYGNRITTLETEVRQILQDKERVEATLSAVQMQYYRLEIRNEQKQK